ncbi:MAG: hypothetical protein WBB37_00960 [bacterium]
MSLFFLLLSGVNEKSYSDLIIPTLRVFIILSAVPYMYNCFISTWSLFLIGSISFLLIIILPEILAFIGLLLIEKPLKILGYICVILAILTAIEILPIRMLYIFDADMEFMHPTDLGSIMSFGKTDRESEFLRSLQTIKQLSLRSQNMKPDRLKKVIIEEPDLTEFPDVLRLDTLYLPPWHMGSDGYWQNMEMVFEKKEYLIDVKLDTDGDGLSDWNEIELLCDAYSKDTDGDGIDDGIDTDPLNPIVVSDYADINTAILLQLSQDTVTKIIYLIDNEFDNGHGEFSNCDEHIIILHPDQISKWNIIFGEQYTAHQQRSFFGQRIDFSKHVMSCAHRFAIVGIVQFHGVWADSSGILFLLMKWQGKWRIIAGRVLWI